MAFRVSWVCNFRFSSRAALPVLELPLQSRSPSQNSFAHVSFLSGAVAFPSSISSDALDLTGRAYLKEWTLVMYGTTSNPDRRKRKYKSPTPAPTISTAKASTVAYVTKSPILNAPGKYGLPPSRVVIDPLRHNNLEEDTLPEMADVDVHGRDMLKAELGE